MSTPLITNVLGRRPFAGSPDAVMEALREQFAGISVELMMPRVDGKRGFGLKVDGIPVILVFEDFGLNLDELKPWHGRLRDAGGPLLDNVAHVMIGTLKGFEGHEPTLRASLAVLRVASVLSERPGAHAVLWSPADSLLPAQAFRADIAEMSAERAPIGILTRIGHFQTGMEDNKPLLGVWAMGLARFVGRDIEFVPKPLPAYQLVNCLASVANWLLLKGPVLKDGDTFGVSETERIRVFHRDGAIMVKTPVLVMDIETLDPGATPLAK